jgi:diguanylate cyclase (GGDEF)-like protein
MARLRQQAVQSGHTVLVVDDDATLLTSLEQLLTQDGHRVLTALNGMDAIRIVLEEDVHLVLLDYFMPGMTGEDVVREVRTFDKLTQIVLQTGYASERPARVMLRDLEIQGYHDKSEGPEKLLVWVDASLKAYRQARALSASRDGLRRILEITPELHRLQPLEHLIRGVLTQMQGLLGLAGVFITAPATTPDGLVGTLEQSRFRVQVGTGRFAGIAWNDLDADLRTIVADALDSGQVQRDQVLVVPLKVGLKSIGAVLVEHLLAPNAELELLELFATQAAVAIENARLYAIATVDDLTRLATRRHWLAQLSDALHLTSRHGGELSVLVMDIDHFKSINDSFGHPAGDRVLEAVGRTVLETLRSGDVAGRFGGEEFAVILPHTDMDGAIAIGERLRERVSRLQVNWQGHHLDARISVGVASLHFTPGIRTDSELDAARDRVIQTADNAMYRAKDAGRNRLEHGNILNLV